MPRCVPHVNYSLQWLHRLNTQTCGKQITAERCTIMKLSGAGQQQIVLPDLILLYFFTLIEHGYGHSLTDYTIHNLP